MTSLLDVHPCLPHALREVHREARLANSFCERNRSKPTAGSSLIPVRMLFATRWVHGPAWTCTWPNNGNSPNTDHYSNYVDLDCPDLSIFPKSHVTRLFHLKRRIPIQERSRVGTPQCENERRNTSTACWPSNLAEFLRP